MILCAVGAMELKNPIAKSFKKASRQQLLKLRNSDSGVIKLNYKNNPTLVETAVRDFNTILFLTVDSNKIHCTLCESFAPIFENSAKYYLENFKEEDDLFFVELEYTFNEPFFKELEIGNVPHVWVVPNYDYLYDYLLREKVSKKDLRDVKHFNIKTCNHFALIPDEGTTEHSFSKYVSQALGIDFDIPEPKKPIFELNENNIAKLVIACSLLIIFAKRSRSGESNFFKKFLQYRVWCGLSILAILLMISGYMFTVVRGVPLVGMNENGPFYFSGGTQYQIGIETFIVAGIYLSIGFFMVLIVDIIPKITKNEDEGENYQPDFKIEVIEKNEEIIVDEIVEKDDGEQVEEISITNITEIEPKILKKSGIPFKINEKFACIFIILASLGLFYSYDTLIQTYLKKDGSYPFRLFH